MLKWLTKLSDVRAHMKTFVSRKTVLFVSLLVSFSDARVVEVIVAADSLGELQ